MMNPSQCVLIAFCVINLSSSLAHAFKCENGDVKIGDSEYEILQKCGEPTYKDQTQVSRVKETQAAYEQDFVSVEDWLYNLGPERFVKILTFEKGKVIGMHTSGYGRSQGDKPDFNKKVKIGDPSVRLLFLYGPPTHKEERVETSVISRKDGVTLPKVTHVEEWTYNLGPKRFMRIYHFKNGRLRKIQQGNRGF
ncbi:MAG: DUF2845 domain-containing protein [Proteobacteria bacterium]|nr:DUF2845 domain-containing protein [Pseudomonadota bacterium]